jgi:hypothetical protein
MVAEAGRAELCGARRYEKRVSSAHGAVPAMINTSHHRCRP